MSISGTLQDLSLSEVLRFLHLGERTGTLSLATEERQAEVGFHSGRIVAAWVSGSRRLGEMLLAAGVIDPPTLRKALRRQQEQEPPMALGRILVDGGTISEANIRQTLTAQLREALGSLTSWRTGRFRFTFDRPRIIDDLALSPGEILRAAPPPEEAADRVREEPPPTGALEAEEPFPLIPLAGSERVAPITRPGGEESGAAARTHFVRLRSALAEVQADRSPAVGTLTLLQLVAEAAERALVFAVDEGGFLCQGGFGTTTAGRPLAEEVRGLRLSHAEAGALAVAASNGALLSVSFSDRPLPESLLRRLETPSSGQAVIFGVARGGETVAVVYADNGALPTPVRGTEFLELAALQVGLVWENETLRRRLAGSGHGESSAG